MADLVRPFAALARVLTRAAGPPALLRAAPPFAAIALFAAVIFGGNGMRPRDLCAVLAASPAVRAALWAAWLLVTAPAARALLEPRDTFVLRALPIPAWQFRLVHGAHLVALHLPWALLFAIGAGPLAGIASGLGAAAMSALVVARPRRLVEVLAAVAIAAAILAGAPRVLVSTIALISGAILVAAAWARAPERSARAGASLVGGRAPVALALAHVAVLVRRDGIVLLRGAAAAITGALVLAFAIRNNAVTDADTRETIAVAAAAIPLALATGGVSVKVLETERRLEWLLLSTAASPRLRALCAAVVTVAWGAIAGAIHGALASLFLDASAIARLRVAAIGIALGASLGAIAASLARRSEQPTGTDANAVTAAMGCAALATMVLAAAIGSRAAVVLLVLAIALLARTPRLLAQRERCREFAIHTPWSAS